MNKDEAKRILKINLKGPKQKPSSLMIVAEAVRLLLNEKEYPNASKLAKDFNASRTIIESFDKMNDQPPEIKQLIQEGKIRIDASTKLSSIPDPRKRIDLARTISGLSSKETRRTIDYYKKHPNLTPEECKKTSTGIKPPEKQLKSVTARLEEKEYKSFVEVLEKEKIKKDTAFRQAISEWTQKRQKEH